LSIDVLGERYGSIEYRSPVDWSRSYDWSNGADTYRGHPEGY